MASAAQRRTSTRALAGRGTCLAALIAGLLTTPASAQSGEQDHAPDPAPATVSPEAAGVAQIVTAARVADWGRSHQDAGALIMAARILAEAPARPAPDAGEAFLTVPRLLDEAAILSEADPAALEAIAFLRGAEVRGVRSSPFGQGPIFMVRELRARETYGFEVEARGGEVLRVAAIGDGDTNIDLVVRDETGTLVCEDGFGDHYPVCTVPRVRPGKMRIGIVNRGAIWTKVQILSN